MNDQPSASIEAVPEPTQPGRRPAATESTPTASVPSTTDEPGLGESDGPSGVEAEGHTAVPDADAAPPEAVDDGFLDDLVLPSLVSAPEPLMPETDLGPDGRLRIVEHLS